MALSDDAIKSHVLFHIMKQYGTQVEGERAWVLPVIEYGPIKSCKISGKVAGNVLVLMLQEVDEDVQ